VHGLWLMAHGSVCLVANVCVHRQAQYVSPLGPFSLVSLLGAFFFGMNPWGLFLAVPQGVIPSFLLLGSMERAHSEGAGLAAHASTGCSIPASHQATRCSKDPGSLSLQPCPALLLSNTQCLTLIAHASEPFCQLLLPSRLRVVP